MAELRTTERELALSSERVAAARTDLNETRDDLTSVIWWTRGLLVAFLLPLALSNVGLYLLGRSLRQVRVVDDLDDDRLRVAADRPADGERPEGVAPRRAVQV